MLNDIKRRFREETFTRESIAQIIHAHPDLVCLMDACNLGRNADSLLRIDPFIICEFCNGALSINRRLCSKPYVSTQLRVDATVHRLTFILWRPTLSYQRLHTTQPLTDEDLHDKMRRAVPNKHELQVLEAFLIFNKRVTCFSRVLRSSDSFFRHVLKTNFYQPTKVALSFRLAPDFLPEVEYPTKPFGLFIVIGKIRYELMVLTFTHCYLRRK